MLRPIWGRDFCDIKHSKGNCKIPTSPINFMPSYYNDNCIPVIVDPTKLLIYYYSSEDSKVKSNRICLPNNRVDSCTAFRGGLMLESGGRYYVRNSISGITNQLNIKHGSRLSLSICRNYIAYYEVGRVFLFDNQGIIKFVIPIQEGNHCMVCSDFLLGLCGSILYVRKNGVSNRLVTLPGKVKLFDSITTTVKNVEYVVTASVIECEGETLLCIVVFDMKFKLVNHFYPRIMRNTIHLFKCMDLGTEVYLDANTYMFIPHEDVINGTESIDEYIV